MLADHLSRQVIIFCCRDGTLTWKDRGKPSFNRRALPVFSVDTHAEAEFLAVGTCALQKRPHPHPDHPGPWFVLASGPFSFGFSGEFEDLQKVTTHLAEVYEAQTAGRKMAIPR